MVSSSVLDYCWEQVTYEDRKYQHEPDFASSATISRANFQKL